MTVTAAIAISRVANHNSTSALVGLLAPPTLCLSRPASWMRKRRTTNNVIGGTHKGRISLGSAKIVTRKISRRVHTCAHSKSPRMCQTRECRYLYTSGSQLYLRFRIVSFLDKGKLVVGVNSIWNDLSMTDDLTIQSRANVDMSREQLPPLCLQIPRLYSADGLKTPANCK
ncbi:hypothetical protein F5887DRAFT_498808 [Amanita rubescens]|nr:hypothetical protein F5887DRAFT_498808 [Amanita rubescens]